LQQSIKIWFGGELDPRFEAHSQRLQFLRRRAAEGDHLIAAGLELSAVLQADAAVAAGN
jgi:hypothetical protein